MGAGKTFTNAIIREIGRNYGKAISNQIMGNSHATPISMTGSRSGNRKYESKLDELIQKLSIKGKVATLNQGQNIHIEFFSIVEEYNKDGIIDISEFYSLASYIPKVVKALNTIQTALTEFEDTKGIELMNSKIQDVQDFKNTLIESFEAAINDKDWQNPVKQKSKTAMLLSLISLDRIYLYSKNWKSYLPPMFLVLLFYILFFDSNDKRFELTASNFIAAWLEFIFLYSLVWNPLFKGGVWKYRKENKALRKAHDNLSEVLEMLKGI